MARKRASMREGPLAELFKATEAAQRQVEKRGPATPASDPDAPTVEHAPPFAVVTEPPPPASRKPRSRPKAAGAKPAGAKPARERPVVRYLEPLPEPAPRLHRAPKPETAAYLAVIRVVGVGGAGLNAINRMIDAGINQVEFVAVNTDMQQLQINDASVKIHIGRDLTKGLGSGADPEVGRREIGRAHV